MKDEANNPIDTDSGDVMPRDVADIAAMLDALGAADRASMPGSARERVCAASAYAMLHPEGVDAAAEAGVIAVSARAEGALVPAGLEERVFEASRGELAATMGLRLAGEGRLPPRVQRVTVRRVWWRTGAARLAAAVAIVGAGAVAFVSLRSDEQGAAPQPDVAVLAASFDSELAALYDLLESTPAASSSDVGAVTDHSITDVLLDWESL